MRVASRLNRPHFFHTELRVTWTHRYRWVHGWYPTLLVAANAFSDSRVPEKPLKRVRWSGEQSRKQRKGLGSVQARYIYALSTLSSALPASQSVLRASDSPPMPMPFEARTLSPACDPPFHSQAYSVLCALLDVVMAPPTYD